MQKIYLLLRNNKQSGPHTLSEIIALQLKPFDLIWVEGRSKAWAYPTELNELKAHVKEEKKPKDTSKVYPVADHKLVLPRTSNKTQSAGKQDKINVQVYVKLPDESQGDRFIEKEAAHTSTKPLPDHPVGPVVQQADSMLNTKYTRDLQEIKEEYTAWIDQRKQVQGNKTQSRPWLIWVIITMLGITGFVVERWISPTVDQSQAAAMDTVTKQEPVVVTKTGKNKKNSRIGDKSDKAKKATAGSPDKKDKKTGVDSARKRTGADKSEKEISKPNSQELFKSLEISYTSDTTTQEGISGLYFTLHNRSSHKLNTVALNIYYHDHEGNVIAKETIHFNNVLPGKASAEHAPFNDKAQTVHYKIALINTEDSIYHGKD